MPKERQENTTRKADKPWHLRSCKANSTALIPTTSEAETSEEEDLVGTRQKRRVIRPLEESTDLGTDLSTEDEAEQTIQTRMANITLTEAVNAARTPATPKFISPPTFNPTNGNALSYVRTYDRTAAANGWTDAYKISYFGTFLEGAAGIWYQEYKGVLTNAAKTWQHISGDFCTQFAGANHLEAAKSKFNNRKQGSSEDIKAYYFDMVALAYDLEPVMPFEIFKEKFEDGLHPSLQETYLMMATHPMTKDQLRNLVLRLSEIKEKALVSSLTSQAALLTIGDRPSEPRRHNPRYSQDRRYQTEGHRRGRPRNNPPQERYPRERQGAGQRERWNQGPYSMKRTLDL
ncbi:hypothetical protein NQ317_016788 [Molorchus minor]|uniref:Retrotransposon gag domain-containing protein n=1 Tax=Molorchus minor TaxID=1323400 RepID=A0ABQ9IUI8_9CUCU|nr:hypothetical protein NQ317_016788 [Molorchus minor]